jgi:ADP-ribose pyrophosphatase YjhB (NUDIX family)
MPSTAIRALEDDLDQSFPGATAQELGYVGKFGPSGSTGEDTLYEYWAYEVSPGPLPAASAGGRSARWVSYDTLAADPDVGWSTKEIARAFVENQEVALAVITRLAATTTEYLLIRNANYAGYFFPAMRIKQELKPDATARAEVRSHLGYHGELITDYRGEVPDAHYSMRFGRKRAYRFHVYKVSLVNLDLNQPMNFLERRLQARHLEWCWVNADQLANLPVPASETLAVVRASVLQMIPPATRDQPLRKSEGGVALIRRVVAGRTEWLAQWNDNWKAFFFVAGHRHGTESFRECVIRETSEELGLAANVDFQVGSNRVKRLEYAACSQSARTDTDYTMELFDVQLLNERARQHADNDPRNRWLTTQEICRLATFDGRPVSVTMGMLLDLAGLVNSQLG